MADVPVFLNHRVLFRETVHHTVILHVRPIFNDDAPKVTAQAGIWPDINTMTEHHIANQYRRWVHVTIFGDDRRQPVNLIYRHNLSLRTQREYTKTLEITAARLRQIAH
ncbi:hypothetical protein D3C75_1005650 [compost metagenome]